MNNLDKILKEKMSDFAPDAPNVWAGIEQGVQANQVVQATKMGKTLFGSKLAFTVAKIVAIALVPTAIISYNYFTTDTNKTNIEKPVQEIVANQEQIALSESNSVGNERGQLTKYKEIESSKKLDKESNSTFSKKTLKKEQSSTGEDNSTSIKDNVPSTTPHTVDKKVNQEVVSSVVKHEKPVSTPIENSTKQSNFFDENESTEENKEIKGEQNRGIDILTKMPTAFSPDNDGVNDKYVVLIEGEKFYNLKIYTMQEELLFESNDKSNLWDGINPKNGQICNSGTYVGVLVYKSTEDVNFRTKRAIIKLVR